MTDTVAAVANVASWMGLLPLAWLAWWHGCGRRPGIAWWWLAAAFAVSWLADTAALWVDPWLVGAVYPVSQAALVGAVLLDRRDAVWFALALVLVAGVDLAWHGIARPDLFLRTVAWLGVVGIVWDRWALGRLRTTLFVAFGLGWVAWLGYACWPGWWTWGTYQGVRLAGLVLFCWAASNPAPSLRLSRGGV